MTLGFWAFFGGLGLPALLCRPHTQGKTIHPGKGGQWQNGGQVGRAPSSLHWTAGRTYRASLGTTAFVWRQVQKKKRDQRRNEFISIVSDWKKTIMYNHRNDSTVDMRSTTGPCGWGTRFLLRFRKRTGCSLMNSRQNISLFSIKLKNSSPNRLLSSSVQKRTMVGLMESSVNSVSSVNSGYQILL